MNHVIVIYRKNNPTVQCTVIEKLDSMSTPACVQAWAQSIGYVKLPDDLDYLTVNFVSMGSIFRNITPFSELSLLEEKGTSQVAEKQAKKDG